jgi:hypothetical protein
LSEALQISVLHCVRSQDSKAPSQREPGGNARCHLGLSKLYRRTGKREQASEHLVTATTMYREMDMRFWLEQAEAELKD